MFVVREENSKEVVISEVLITCYIKLVEDRREVIYDAYWNTLK
jgi:hypothetical protein